MSTILVYSKGAYILITNNKNNIFPPKMILCLIFFFSGTEGATGAAKDGAKYYEVKRGMLNEDVSGCYEKIEYHSVRPEAPGQKFPIYKQTGAGGSFQLRIDENKKGAPWIFTDVKSDIKFE